ncbi:MAG: hypothetical protein KAI43_09005 [Candidatus Aureabacteria bacterium]|nr:hypothetical protein [Candidatus Auribacterota bacterium]
MIKELKKGYVLLEVLISLVFIMLLLPMIAKMLTSSVYIMEKSVTEFHLRTLAVKNAELDMLDDKTSFSNGRVNINYVEYIWKKEKHTWDSSRGLYLMTITVRTNKKNELYELSYIKKI